MHRPQRQVDHIDDQGRQTHLILSILVNVEAGKGGKTHLLHNLTQFSFKVMLGSGVSTTQPPTTPTPSALLALGLGLERSWAWQLSISKMTCPPVQCLSCPSLPFGTKSMRFVCMQPWEILSFPGALNVFGQIVSMSDNSYVEEGFQPGEDSTKPVHVLLPLVPCSCFLFLQIMTAPTAVEVGGRPEEQDQEFFNFLPNIKFVQI
jgi:hypothetical protein